MLKAGGSVEDYEAKADSVKANLRQELQCDLPACELTVTVKAGSVILTVVATDTSGGASQVEWAAVILQTKALDEISSVLGVTIEEPPATPSVIDVILVQVMRLAPSPPPPSPPPTSPSGALWALLPLSLLVAAAVLFVLYYRRTSRNEANLRISRDRANLDLQMITHQQVQIRVETHSDDSASLPDSLPVKRSISFRKAPAASLPPSPPSSCSGQSVAEQEVSKSGASDSGAAPTASAPLAAPTFLSFPSPRKRPAKPESATAPLAKRAFTSPCALLRVRVWLRLGLLARVRLHPHPHPHPQPHQTWSSAVSSGRSCRPKRATETERSS